ncbi:Low density lipoprotein receptor adapter protein 1 [Frankliniella fusca]|uniref:Low density lipoprotein receptor adapter protein 1 n=1 Tax=Frankliniella fusca TaxID=407009 RepID=A0AAE1HD73_9NEOP|nr:Low density lipoprotein receptor adapter protein 1 [Frankliniella fusca]
MLHIISREPLSPRCARPRRPLRLFASPRSSVHRSPRPRSSARSPSSPARSPSWARPPPASASASAVVPAGFVPCRLPFGSPGRTPGRPGRAKASLRARVQARAKAALMKKFSSSASAWVTSRPNSTSTPIVPNNYTKDADVGATTPSSRAAPPPQQQQQQQSLPQTFPVKCLGWRESRGLWGVKHTRAPVDAMVAAARALPAGQGLERATLEVSAEGVSVDGRLLPIDCISYGVQDLVYTRVFCCVLVSRPDAPGPPFKCHAFVCESRAQARALTYALAAAFQEYSRAVKQRHAAPAAAAPRVVDLRTPEDIAAEMLSHCQDSEA